MKEKDGESEEKIDITGSPRSKLDNNFDDKEVGSKWK